ncbi:hypothetical protein [Antarcticirhabdus aurantiaca]|uniref:Uncharacterized protein n=1 Tax=Antarcticirhabdus aurantiaca TaxID=2606717 RepID=A0ACD4NJ27_9HYPH|nr:hypothetical protein OXU80_18635 [Jeongeuplla avenae]
MTMRPAKNRGSALELGDRIERLARRVERLSVSRHDPEAFFEERSEIVAELRREASRAADVEDYRS